MASQDISQAEADALFRMEKYRLDERSLPFPSSGGKLIIELSSADGREEFHLDIYRGKRKALKVSLQNRARSVIRLCRLDIYGPKHTNPDGQVIPTPHLHKYREKYRDGWAEPVPRDRFSNLDNIWITLQEFMHYCNIVNPPLIKRDLFT